MNLRDEILKEHSKVQCEKIVAGVGSSQKKFDELLHLFLNDEYRVVQRAGWPLSEIARKFPHLFLPHLPDIAAHARRRDQHPAFRRNICRIMEAMVIPETNEGEWMDLAFQFLEDPSEAIAVKAHCISILTRLCIKYPEIIPELRLLLAEQKQTPALRARINVFEKMVKAKNKIVNIKP